MFKCIECSDSDVCPLNNKNRKKATQYIFRYYFTSLLTFVRSTKKIKKI